MFSKSSKIIILFEIILKFLLISGQTEENCWGQCLCYDFTIRCVLVNFQSVPNNFSRQTKTLWVVLCKCITTFSSCILFKAIYPGAGDPGGLGAVPPLELRIYRVKSLKILKFSFFYQSGLGNYRLPKMLFAVWCSYGLVRLAI